MLEAMLSFPLHSETVKWLKTLHAAFSERYLVLKGLSQEELEAIHHYARISQIGASTRIENAILTDSEISWLDTLLTSDGKTSAFQQQRQIIENKLSKERQRSIEEVAGCRAMLSLIYEQSHEMLPLAEIHIRGLHQELLRHYKDASHYRGQYKKNPNSVVEHHSMTGRKKEVFKTADPGVLTATAMADLVRWYSQAIQTEPWSVAVACEFVFRFLAIHPFQDGNGRVGRGLFLLCLLQCPDPHVSFVARYLSIDRQIEKHKEDYYFVLNRCSDGKYKLDPKKYHIEYFLSFMTKTLDKALKDVDFYQKKFRASLELSIGASQVLACFKDLPEKKLQTRELVKRTNLPRRTVSNALVALLKNGFIQKYGKGAAVRYQIIF